MFLKKDKIKNWRVEKYWENMPRSISNRSYRYIAKIREYKSRALEKEREKKRKRKREKERRRLPKGSKRSCTIARFDTSRARFQNLLMPWCHTYPMSRDQIPLRLNALAHHPCYWFFLLIPHSPTSIYFRFCGTTFFRSFTITIRPK